MSVSGLGRAGAGDEIDFEPGLIPQYAGFADHLDRGFVGQSDQIPVTRDVIGQDLCRSWLGAFGQFFVGHDRHGANPIGQALLFL